MNLVMTTSNADETMCVGKALSKFLKAGDILLFYGGLGAGKTTFTKGVASGLGIDDHIHSPTFTLIHEHYGKNTKLYHVDLYRLESLDEIENLGIDEYLYSQAITLIEWSEKFGNNLPKSRIDIKIKHQGDFSREIIFESESHKSTLENLEKELNLKCIS